MNRIFSPERFAGTRKVLAMLALGLVLSAQAALTGCNQHAQDPGDFTAEELKLIASADSIMRVLTIADRSDSLILRDTSRTFSARRAVHGRIAIDCRRKNFRNTRFPRTARATEQIRMPYPARFYLVFQNCNDMFLSNYVVERSWSKHSI